MGLFGDVALCACKCNEHASVQSMEATTRLGGTNQSDAAVLKHLETILHHVDLTLTILGSSGNVASTLSDCHVHDVTDIRKVLLLSSLDPLFQGTSMKVAPICVHHTYCPFTLFDHDIGTRLLQSYSVLLCI